MNFTPFTATPKKKSRHWPNKDAEGGVIPYKVILVDMQAGPPTTEQEETAEFKKLVAAGVIDEDDEEDMEDVKNQFKQSTSQGVFTFALLGNHINGRTKWFNIEDLRFCR